MLLSRESILMCCAVVLGACSRAGDATESTAEYCTVTRGPLSIRLVEAGELEAASQTMIRSEVEGMATIISLVEEGAAVKKGDPLIELDVSNLIDRRASKEIDLAKAEAARVQAEQDLVIQLKEIVASEGSARSKLTVAEMEMEKFRGRLPTSGSPTLKATNADMLGDLKALIAGREKEDLLTKVRDNLVGNARYEQAELGEMAQDVLAQIDDVRLKEADLKIKAEAYEQSKRLFTKEFVTKSDLERDEYQYQSQLSRVTLAFNELELLINYNLRKTKIELEQNLSNAKLELERVLANNLARKAREQAEFHSKEAEYLLAKERFENLVYQIDHAKILAPTDGLVVYAEKGGMMHRRNTIEEGSKVHNRQPLILLPDVSKIIAVIRIQEADFQKISQGQRATIKIDAFKDKSLTGKVRRIAPLPDSRSRFENKDLKVYLTEVLLDGDNDVLRPGMSATVTLDIADLDDVLQVPLQAVNVQGEANYVWKDGPKGPEALRVEIGAIGLRMVELRGGVEPHSSLAEGDRLYLTPPKGVTAPEFEQSDHIRPATRAEIEQAREQLNTTSPSASNNLGDASAQLLAALKKKFPDRTDLQSPRDLMQAMRDPEIRTALEQDPGLQAMADDLQQSFMQMMRSRGNRPGSSGERSGRDRRRGGSDRGQRGGRAGKQNGGKQGGGRD